MGGGFIENFKKGYSGQDSHRFEVGGVRVKCTQCGGVEFDEGSALLNTMGLTLLGLDWANREASLLICMQCSHVEWFLANPVEVP